MLTNISIKNIILIDQLDIELKGGFCVLTGETGAGKSILLNALGFALGNKAGKGLLRTGEKQGSVVASFSSTKKAESLLEEQAIESDGEIHLRRIITNDGKTKAFANDVPITVSFLTQIASVLIEIHGQHDQRGLFDQSTHGLILDSFGRLEDKLGDVENAYNQFNLVKGKLNSLKELSTKSKSEEDYLSYVKEELEKLSPEKGEEEKLNDKRVKLKNKGKLLEVTGSALSNLLDGKGADDSIRTAQNILYRNVELDKKFEEIIEILEKASIETNEAISGLEEVSASIGEGGENIDQIEERLFALRSASRKYNVPVDELGEYYEEVKEKLSTIQNSDDQIKQLEKELEGKKIKYEKIAEELSSLRKNTAVLLEQDIHKELEPLKMGNTKFKVEIEKLPQEKWGLRGFDKIIFLASTNPGLPFAPLSKIASGGELSRFMLAIKVVMSRFKSASTMIFDEIDTGISGATSDAVGKRLSLLGKTTQVLAITHQPQVAAYGNYHLKVSKAQNENQTKTLVNVLSDESRKEEIARLLAGESITDEAKAAAEKLLTV